MPTAAELKACTALITVSTGSTLVFCLFVSLFFFFFQVADWSNHSTYLKS